MEKCDALFQLGKIVATADVYDQHTGQDVNLGVLLQRHVLGDWGNVPDDIRYQNNRVLRSQGMLISRYACQHHIIQIVTHRQLTTISVLDDA